MAETETKVTHAPGPWEISSYTNYYGYSISAKGVGCIAERWWPTEQGVDMPIEANAHLIAAAPDMLEALELEQFVEELKAAHDPRDIIRLLESRGDYESGHLSTGKLLEEYAIKAALARQAAIAKAKGGAA